MSLVEFGHGQSREVHSFCGGINDDKDEGCGWEEIYSANIGTANLSQQTAPGPASKRSRTGNIISSADGNTSNSAMTLSSRGTGHHDPVSRLTAIRSQHSINESNEQNENHSHGKITVILSRP